jgi:hypothetical protein
MRMKIQVRWFAPPIRNSFLIVVAIEHPMPAPRHHKCNEHCLFLLILAQDQNFGAIIFKKRFA